MHAELLELLCTCYFRRMHPLPDYDDPVKNMECLKIHDLFMNDIILRLCKFRDTDSRSISFEQVLKQHRKRLDTNTYEEIKQLILKYRALTKNIEAHRDTRIAHLAKRDTTHLKPPFEMEEAVRMAIDIGDRFAGNREEYKLLDIDLCRAVLSDKQSNHPMHPTAESGG